MPRSGALLAVLLALAPLAGCLGPAQGGPSGAVPFETVTQGADSGIEDREETVVRASDAWEQLWQRHAPDEDRPAIDFEERMVVAIFKGQSPDGCHGAVIENVTGDGSQLTVEGAYVEVTDAHCTQQITYPFHIVALDKHDVPVTFNVTEETRERGDDGQEDGDDGGSGDGGTYACRTEGSGEASSGEGATVGFETIDEGSQSQLHERCLTVAWNETAWRDLWRDHYGGSTADETRPEVDFSRSVVAGVFKGQSPDACHGAEIDNVTQHGDDVVVHGAFYVVEGGACAEVVTYPFHIVELDRPDGEVRFDVREETRQQDDDGSDDGAAYECRDPGEDGSATTGEAVDFDTLDEGADSGIEEPCVTVARNETAWRDLWRDHAGGEDSRPAVDFDQRIVAAIFKGQSADACHGAEIEDVTRDGEDLVVHGVFSTAENDDTACAEVITYPFHIVELDRPDGEVRFDVRDETG